MKKILLVLLVSLFLVGCDNFPNYKYSKVKEESAEIITMNYVPSRSSTNMSPGMNMNGDLVLSIHSTSFPEVYAITLRCAEHNKTFTFQSKALFSKVKISEIVTLRYMDKIKYFPYDKEHKYEESVVGQHTTQILCKDESVINK